MRLTYLEADRPDDTFVINDRTDSNDPIVRNGGTFEVTDERARFLLARYYPRLQPAP